MRFGLVNGVNDGTGVFLDGICRKGSLPDGHMDVSGLINLEFDSTRFHFFDGATGIIGYSAGLRIGH